MRYQIPVYSVGFISAVMLFVSCKGNKEVAAPVIPEATVVTVGQQTVPIYAEYVGETYGRSDVEIRPRVEGWVRGIHFKEGARVEKGQLLYTIQDDELVDREQMAKANLAEAKVMLVKVKSDLDRVKPLVEMNALSRRDLDAAQAAYDAQQQAVVSAQAALQNAQTQLGYSRILAPVTGTIGITKVQVGDYVSKIMATPINTVSDIDRMRVRFAITESDYLAYRKKIGETNLQKLPITLILNDGSVFPETATLDFANRQVDPETGSLLIQAEVNNKDRLLRPGQYVKVRFQSDLVPNAILVPQGAINQMQSMFMAFVVGDSNKIAMRPVKTGPKVGSNWVITEGLKPGEKVAMVGNAIIKPGMPVKPVMKNYSYDSTSSK